MNSKWNAEKENLEKLILEEKLSYEEIGRRYNCSGANIKKAALLIGIEVPKRRAVNPSENFGRGTIKVPIKVCLNCGREFRHYSGSTGKYCSIGCKHLYESKTYLDNWMNGVIDGTVSYNCSSIIRKYLFLKYNYSCLICGWNQVNPYTNKVPLLIHHIDGNSLNNKEENLQVLCPNCHSLTENFGSRNKNAPKGRSAYYGKAKS